MTGGSLHVDWLAVKIVEVGAGDWYNDDGLYFKRELTDFHGLFHLVQTPRDLLASTSDDAHVHVGVVAGNRSWYLRYRAEWDDQGETLDGGYWVTLSDELIEMFEAVIVPTLECPIRRAAPDEERDSSE